MVLADILDYVGMGMWVFAALLTLIGALKGRSRGLCRQIVRTITVAASLLIALFATQYVYNFISGWIGGQTTASMLSMLEGFGIDLGDAGALLSYFKTSSLNHLLAIPLALILLPLIFVIVFVIVSIVIRLIHGLICQIIGFHKYRNNFVTRLLGMIIGAVQGAAVAIVCLIPIIGICTTLSGAVAEIQESDPNSEATASITKTYEENIKPLAENSAVVIMNKAGGELLYGYITTININGTDHAMAEEIATPALKTFGAIKNLSKVDLQYMTEEEKAAINTLLEVAEESPYVATLVADVLDSVAKAYKNGVLGETDEGLVKDLVDAILSVFDGIDSTTLVPTLGVIRDVFFMLSDEEVLSTLSGDTALLTDIFTKKDENGDTLITRLTAKLNSNERTAPLVSTFTEISIQVMADSFGGVIDAETYDNVKDGIKDIISIDKESYDTHEEYVEAISDSLNDTLAQNGIEVEKDIIDEMAGYVADNYSEVEDLTDAEINDIILSYYNAYLQSGELPTVPPVID